MISIFHSHRTGSANSRQACAAFLQFGWLEKTMLSLAWTHQPKVFRLLPRSILNEINRRVYEEIPQGNILLSPWSELLRLVGQKTKLPFLSRKLRERFDILSCNQRFDQAAAGHVSKSKNITAVFCYFDTALATFRAAEKKHILKIYELPTPYWKTVKNICCQEQQRRPDWARTLPHSSVFEAVGERRDEELQLADVVVVPSKFVLDSLNDAPNFKGKVVIVPYGSPENMQMPNGGIEYETGSKPLKLLFAGTLAQSKGIADLLEAAAKLQNKVTVTLAGENQYGLAVEDFPPNCRYIGHLPNSELVKQMHENDVFVLPTFYEGLSIALLEAMRVGMAVVSTTNCGLNICENSMQKGAILIEPGRPEQLIESLNQLIVSPEKIATMKTAARMWAENHTWAEYRVRLCNVLKPLIER